MSVNIFSPAMQDYIKAIFLLETQNKVARVSDIGRHLNVKKASVVAAVSFLQKNQLIAHERYGFITLTEQGKQEAQRIYRKNQAVLEFLSDVLNIEKEKAKEEACGMEHSLSEETAEKLISFTKSFRSQKPKPSKTKHPKPAKKKK